MLDIKEMVYVLYQNNLQPVNQAGKPIEHDSKMGLFIEGLRSGKINTDEDAISLLYPDNADSTSYRKLKSTFRDRLIDSIYQFDAYKGNFSEYQKAYYDCHRKWLVVKILTGLNANTSALSLAKKLLKEVERYEFTLLCLDLYSYLMLQFGIREGNDKKYIEASELFERYAAMHKAECLAEKLYADLISRQVNSKTSNDKIYQEAVKSYKIIKPYLDEYDSFKIQLYGNMIGLSVMTAKNDIHGTLDFCQNAIKVFEGKSYEAVVPLQVFNYQQLQCCIHLKRFEEGRKSARFCLSVSKEGTFNWFKCKELFILLCLHTEQFQQAGKELEQVLKNERLAFMPEHTREIWTIFDYYLSFLEIQHLAPKRKGGSVFKAAKFENELPILSKDKTGMNVSKLVIKMLFLLQARAYSQIIDETDALEQYCYRHLNKKETERSLYFFKMLIQIGHSGFDPEVIRKKTSTFFEKLSMTSQSTSEIEVIPYEYLWDLISTKLLQRKR